MKGVPSSSDDALKCVRRSQELEHATINSSAPLEVAEARESPATTSRLFDRLPRGGFHALDQPETQPQGESPSPSSVMIGLQRAVPVASLDVNGAYRLAMTLEIGDQEARWIEAHRKGVEQTADERRGMVSLEVGRGIDQQSEGGGVRLGEAVLRESLDLFQDLLGEGLFQAVRAHAVEELLRQLAHSAGAAP